MSPPPPLYKWQMMCFACLFSEDFKPRWPNVTAYCRKKNVNLSHKITCQQQKDSSTSALTTVQLDSFNTSIFFSIFHCWRNNFTISNQSQHCSEESFSTLLQREEAFMWSENTRLIFFFFSSYETLLFKQPEWIVSVHLSPITFTWVWMSLAAENLAL